MKVLLKEERLVMDTMDFLLIRKECLFFLGSLGMTREYGMYTCI